MPSGLYPPFEITMKTHLRSIAKKILKLYPNLEVSELIELIKDKWQLSVKTRDVK
jgi:hypothetical protein